MVSSVKKSLKVGTFIGPDVLAFAPNYDNWPIRWNLPDCIKKQLGVCKYLTHLNSVMVN